MVSVIGKKIHTVYCPHHKRALEKGEDTYETSFSVDFVQGSGEKDFEFIFKFCEECDDALFEALKEE